MNTYPSPVQRHHKHSGEPLLSGVLLCFFPSSLPSNVCFVGNRTPSGMPPAPS
jgi:hypothetical protein